MVYDRKAAETALVRYNNNPPYAKSGGLSRVGPLTEALAMLRAGFDIMTTPFLQVRQCAVRMGGPTSSTRQSRPARSLLACLPAG